MNNARLSEMSRKRLTKRNTWELTLHNDNSVSFDHVMNCLVELCGHNEYQANQCALLTHKRGRCSIFVDKYDTCIDVKDNLVRSGLTVTIRKKK